MQYTVKQFLKRGGALLLALALLAGLLAYVNMVFRPIFFLRDTGQEFYRLQPNSVDIITIGTSAPGRGFSPLVLWKETGIPSCMLYGSSQDIYQARFCLQQAFKTQAPSIILLEANVLWTDFMSTKNFIRGMSKHPFSLDKTQFCYERFKLVKRSAGVVPEEKFGNYFFPFPLFHDRWKDDLRASDFSFSTKYPERVTHGQVMVFPANKVSFDAYNNSTNGKQEQLNPERIAVLGQMQALCKANNAQLILFKMPTSKNWTKIRSAETARAAKSFAIPFYDFFPMREEMGISTKSDYMDPSHLIAGGGAKFTKFLGKFITEQLRFTGKVKVDTKAWERDYALYERMLMANSSELRAKNFAARMQELASDPNYVVLFVTKGHMSARKAEQIAQAGWALRPESAYYLAVVDGGRVLRETIGSEEDAPLTYALDLCGKHFYLKSDKNTSSVFIDNVEYSKKGDGINFVVYDKLLGTVVKLA